MPYNSELDNTAGDRETDTDELDISRYQAFAPHADEAKEFMADLTAWIRSSRYHDRSPVDVVILPKGTAKVRLELNENDVIQIVKAPDHKSGGIKAELKVEHVDSSVQGAFLCRNFVWNGHAFVCQP